MLIIARVERVVASGDFLAVRAAATIGVAVGRVGAVGVDLCTIAQAIAIGVRVCRIGVVVVDLVVIGESVTVRIGIEGIFFEWGVLEWGWVFLF